MSRSFPLPCFILHPSSLILPKTMAAPTYSAGTLGNVLNGVALAAGGTKNAAALVDLSTVLGGALHCQMTTGATAPTAGRAPGTSTSATLRPRSARRCPGPQQS